MHVAAINRKGTMIFKKARRHVCKGLEGGKERVEYCHYKLKTQIKRKPTPTGSSNIKKSVSFTDSSWGCMSWELCWDVQGT